MSGRIRDGRSADHPCVRAELVIRQKTLKGSGARIIREEVANKAMPIEQARLAPQRVTNDVHVELPGGQNGHPEQASPPAQVLESRNRVEINVMRREDTIRFLP